MRLAADDQLLDLLLLGLESSHSSRVATEQRTDAGRPDWMDGASSIAIGGIWIEKRSNSYPGHT